VISLPTRLQEAGVLGINRRNIEFTLAENPRRLYPLVDDKLRTKAICQRLDVPTAEVFATARIHSEVRRLITRLHGRSDFVLKPASGAMGNGILVVREATETTWTTAGGRVLDHDDLAYHAASIISGLYALGGRPDVAFAEERLELHPELRRIAESGVPDIRVIVFRGVPVMAMTRLPTRRSGGRANLHHGAVGAGIDLVTGRTNHAVIFSTPVERHPDTHERVIGCLIPGFPEALRIALRAADGTGLGYVGADVVVDATRGPVLLELNARPGLAIQIANRAGLRKRLEAIRRAKPAGLDAEARIALGCEIASEIARRS
jgi:alpha-L-glutamate ligase-like protein